MREKQMQCVVTFKTTTQAMAFEEISKKAALTGRLIPLPREIAAGCGLSWKDNLASRTVIEELISKYNLKYDEIYEIMI